MLQSNSTYICVTGPAKWTELAHIKFSIVTKPPSIMLKILPIMLLGISQKFPLLYLDFFLLCSIISKYNYTCELHLYTYN